MACRESGQLFWGEKGWRDREKGEEILRRLSIRRGALVVLAAWLALAGPGAGLSAAAEMSPYGNPFLWISLGRVKVQAEVVSTPEKRGLGLSQRRGLPEGQGMLFWMPKVEVQHFCMRGMEFPLDFIWIVRGRVVGLAKQVPPTFPGTLSSPEPVNYVLEVPAGFADRYGIRVGDEVKWEQ
jgi:uncharacterized membrane protein (UPF0127 family)